LMRNGRDRRSENPISGHARKERVFVFGTDQRITSGPAVKTTALKGRIHDCTERFADSQIPLAPRAPSIHDPNVWSGRASQEVFVDLSALRSCINVSGLCLERRYAPGHHGCQRARGLISGQASKRAKRVTRVRMRREDRSSISSRPLADLGGKRDYVIVSPSSVSFVRAVSRSFVL
jgi:hypothetical protein